MEIIIRRRNSDQEVQITTEHDDPDKVVSANLKGFSLLVEDVKTLLSDSYGHFGHLIEDITKTTNLDLLAACQKLDTYDFVSSRPETLEKSRIPANAQS
ncbi:MAG: hypothetical protein KME30_17175 [Iphinoe sp. HA4291-MV1]|jgi:hypothetical protein|nr:hypothetical protein [Iphinoe sp. HA4291-MV1]